MAAITRRGALMAISTPIVLADADDLDGSSAASLAIDVSGAARVILTSQIQTAGTAGIDIVEISKDSGVSWAAADDVLLIGANDKTGTVLAAGAMQAAGVEPITTVTQIWKAGPYDGIVRMRIGRKTTDTTGTTWVTGAPSVRAYLVGGNHSGGAPTSYDNGVTT